MSAEQPTSEQSASEKLPTAGSGSGTSYGYLVQARYAYHEPKEVCGILLDNRWRTLYFQKSPIGVPTRGEFDWHLAAARLMTHEAAQALRWWFHAQCKADLFGGFCLETRLVKFKAKYSFETEALGVFEQQPDAWRDAL